VLPITGEMNPETAEAVRRFQAERGLDSPVLSLAAARELGLAATSLEDL
jgi:peptidoglycan hydrolase-like protein with peptidoglycan-binding domain